MRYLPVIIWLALLVYCLIDVIQADESRVRNLPKVAWILLVVIFPFAGSIAWLVAGRPQAATAQRSSAGYRGRTRPVAPDDDPEFLAGLSRRTPPDVDPRRDQGSGEQRAPGRSGEGSPDDDHPAT